MPWQKVEPMNEKVRFINDYLNDYFSLSELCRHYGISRKTGYKWIDRFQQYGPLALEDQSRRPNYSPNKTPDFVVSEILNIRSKHPYWGPKKILWRIEKDHPDWVLPAKSTASLILQRNGCIKKKRKSMKRYHPGKSFAPVYGPNDTWTLDFKGHFKTKDGIYCYPLTLADQYSRYLLACQGLLSTKHMPVKKQLMIAFHTFGLPKRIRSDNGGPFASVSLGRLSRLSVWWIRLGILPELIEPGHPEQNSVHERMHRTLKQQTVIPPAKNLKNQQVRFVSFRDEFNYERPHDGIGMQLPAELYEPSFRPMPKKLPQVEYPSHYEVRLVSKNSGIKWKKTRVCVSHLLAGEYVGLEEVDNGLWDVYFGPVWLGRLCERTMKIIDKNGKSLRKTRPVNNKKCYPCP
jgi:transposase InsO family protein